MTDFPSLEFRWRYTPSLFSALPLAPVKFLHVNVLLLYYLVAVLFVLCLAICSLCSVLPSFAPVPCNASINKSCASHFCPVRVRILWLLAAVIKNCLSVPFTYRTLCGRASLPPPPFPILSTSNSLKRGSISPSLIQRAWKRLSRIVLWTSLFIMFTRTFSAFIGVLPQTWKWSKPSDLRVFV